MADEITINFTKDEISQRLRETFKPEHAKDMTDCILDLIESSSDLEVIFKLTLGIKPELNYSVGEHIICKINSLSTYSWDKEMMKEQGLIKEDHISVRITEAKKYSANPYTVAYNYISDSDQKIRKATSTIRDKDIIGYTEGLPGDESP